MTKRQIVVEVNSDDTDDVIVKKVKTQTMDLKYQEDCLKEFDKTVEKIEEDYRMFTEIRLRSAVNLFMNHILPLAKGIVRDNENARDEIEKKFQTYPKHVQEFIDEDYDAYGEFMGGQDVNGACEQIWNRIETEVYNKKL